MFILENDQIRIAVAAKGAELNSVFNKKLQLEYMWSGDPLYWNKTSPALFPIVGMLKNDTYFFNDRAWRLFRHGFVREMEFIATRQSGSSVTLSVDSNNETIEDFPFPFRLEIIYSIHTYTLDVVYRVVNIGQSLMYFSLGGHPAFKVPLLPGHEYTDYFLEFNEPEHSKRWPVTNDGLIETVPVPFFHGFNRLPLTKDLFIQDAVVFKDLCSTSVQLRTTKSQHGFEIDFTGFPYLGIWAANNADFVCIEPWCGIADPVNTNQQLEQKEGINRLEPNAVFERNWSLTVF
jgi:galactose mutarotase-like enzyme